MNKEGKMLKRICLLLASVLGCLSIAGCASEKAVPEFTNVEVHDPSVVKVENTYYVFGSHLAAAKSDDLMNWEQISTLPRPNNPMFPNVDDELKETLEYAETNTLWAPDVIQLSDGRYYFYYNACRGDSPLSAMGLAVSDNIEGPYSDLGIFLKSGMSDGIYNANEDPNVVDPGVFFDETGKLWMIYGSYSGGIFILEMDENTGFPLDGQDYGKKLLGGYHARIEGPYIQYCEESQYYYLFLSYGGLDANGGYNVRVARSKNPDGPYVDSQGNEMTDVMGTPGTIFDDQAYAPYGHKLIGNFRFLPLDDGDTLIDYGYVSPGHNSTFYDEEEDKYYILFHTRFPKTGNSHQVRVHQFYLNDFGWPVISAYRYAGEKMTKLSEDEVVGSYRMVDHGLEISADIKDSVLIELEKDSQVTGDVSGTWELYDNNKCRLVIGDVEYTGYFIEQYSQFDKSWLMTFTVGSEEGNSIWGSK